jgi:hypothetical protein
MAHEEHAADRARLDLRGELLRPGLFRSQAAKADNQHLPDDFVERGGQPDGRLRHGGHGVRRAGHARRPHRQVGNGILYRRGGRRDFGGRRGYR